jgi:hypothetical protein
MLKRVFLVFFLACPVAAFAYLDPGSGSALLYALVGLCISVIYFVKGLWLDVTLFFGRAKGDGGLLETEADILFHSEGPQYDHVFFPVLSRFDGTERIVYVTQYERPEASFPRLPDFVSHFAIDSGPRGFASLNLVRAKVFVTTTPQLDVMMFRRSKKVPHYCHLLHAACDISTYRFFAFDQFDSILCAGDYMKDSFRELERQRKTRPKLLLTTGVTYFDDFARRAGDTGDADNSGDAGSSGDCRSAGQKTLLIAPSWGPNSLFAVYGASFLERVPRGYEVVVRPHPQMKVSQKALYDEMRGAAERLGFTVNESSANGAILAGSDALITDFSGVAYDFAFGYGKPVIVVDTKIDYSLFEGRFLNTAPLPEGVRVPVGTVVGESDLPGLGAIVERAMAHGKEQASAQRDRYVANFGRAGEVAKAQLVDILHGVN